MKAFIFGAVFLFSNFIWASNFPLAVSTGNKMKTAHKENKGHSKLIKAIIDGNVKKILKLIPGANLNKRDADRNTALHHAVYLGEVKIVSLLLKAGANFDLRNWSHSTALHYAAGRGEIAIVKLLVGAGANLNYKSSTGNTALHYAIFHGYEEIVRLLLKAKANPNIRNGPTNGLMNSFIDTGWVPLHYAASLGYGEIVILLLDNGAKINARVKGQTACAYAASQKHYNVVKIIKGKGGTCK